MGSLEANDIKALFFFQQRDFANGNFTFSWIFLLFHGFFFFSSSRTYPGKNAPFLAHKRPGRFVPLLGTCESCKRMAVHEHSWSY